MINNRRPLFWTSIIVLLFVFIYLIHSILLPFVLGILTAYFLDPAADRLEKAGLSRGMSTLTITGGFFCIIIILSLIIIPVMISQFSGFIAALPGYITQFQEKYAPEIARWAGVLPDAQIESIKSAVSDFSGIMVKLAGDFITSLFYSGMAVVNLLSLILITPVVAFYLLRDWDRIVELLDRLLPRPYANTIREQMLIIDETLAGFLRGQINVCLMLAAWYGIGLSIAGLKFGLMIGIMTGLLVILPYAGFGFGLVVGMGVAFFQFEDAGSILTVFAVFGVGQIIEGYFLTPKLVGEKVGLHPVWIIFGMLAGAALFGFVGVLLAVPATAIIGVLIRFAIQQYLNSDYYNGERHLSEKSHI